MIYFQLVDNMVNRSLQKMESVERFGDALNYFLRELLVLFL